MCTRKLSDQSGKGEISEIEYIPDLPQSRRPQYIVFWLLYGLIGISVGNKGT